jgi:hypothetical protein
LMSAIKSLLMDPIAWESSSSFVLSRRLKN